ncbi:MAG TPA: AAA family ATPase [Legionella sp.]|nr:AAA family ATPase [Legionella sp.]
MTKHIILTGAMGSGKSTVLNLLKQKGYITVEEPARPILAEQRSIEDEGVPEKNPKLFTQLLLSRAMYQYKLMQKMGGIIIYDRGVPDNIAYAQLFNLDYHPAHLAAKLYRYHPYVFVFPAWEEIYTTDDERTMSFEAAKTFGDEVRAIYRDFGYSLIDIPYVSPEERVQFIINHLGD